MIARTWQGDAATREHADAYEAMLKPELLPGLSRIPGYPRTSCPAGRASSAPRHTPGLRGAGRPEAGARGSRPPFGRFQHGV